MLHDVKRTICDKIYFVVFTLENLAEQSMKASDINRFYVVSDKEAIFLHGVLYDGMNLRPLGDLLETMQVIDFSNVKYASWQALMTLHEFLHSRAKEVSLKNIPCGLYNSIKLIKNFSKYIHLASFELKFIRFSNGKPEVVTRKINIKRFPGIFDENGTFSSINDHFPLMTQWQILPKNNRYLDLEPRCDPYIIDQDFELFTYSYSKFVLCNFVLAKDILRSVFNSITGQLRKILLGMQNFSDCLKVFQIDFGAQSILDLNHVLERIEGYCLKEMSLLSDTEYDLESLVAEYQVELMKGEDVSNFQLAQHYKKCIPVVMRCAEIPVTLDETGAIFGQVLFDNNNSNTLRNHIDSIDCEIVSNEQLKKVREHLNIMNPLSEDSWEETMDDINDEMTLLDDLFKQCVPLLQGFDLTMQVIDHRLNEFRLISEFLEQHQENYNWSDLRIPVLEKVHAKLVTEQEKFSFYYYLQTQIFDSKTSKDDSGLNPKSALFF